MINGIKPTITKKTLLDSKTPFGEAMDKFLNKLTENGKEYIKRYKLIDDVVFKIDGGTKFLKVKHFETRISTDYENNLELFNSSWKDEKLKLAGKEQILKFVEGV